jgi:LmbE family N-acetylglucosaminyl deacetylase
MNPSLAGATVLAIFAHPDDESLACGGTLARLVDEGARVVVWSASHGERGAETGPARDDTLGRLRAN